MRLALANTSSVDGCGAEGCACSTGLAVGSEDDPKSFCKKFAIFSFFFVLVASRQPARP
jgi:hypothetical protein